ncbi:MAG: zinc ribbon domain-containing protein [Dehalococcoidia bacterium]|nr:zinc ribbon domain-containing protein [Dehalococcoidia bacterium]
MPTYQYQCLNCKSQFELRQSFDDKPIADCPACHGVARRLFCPVPIVFKGPGFYCTDSKGDGGKKSGDNES